MSIEVEFVQEVSKCKSLLNHIIRKAGPGKQFEGEDLKQEILFNAWRSYPSFRGESKFSTWLYRIGLLTVYQDFRKSKNRQLSQCINLSEGFEFEHPNSSIFIDPEDELKQLLADDELRLFKLYLNGHSYEEIATQLGISANNTGVKVHRIRKKLMKVF